MWCVLVSCVWMQVVPRSEDSAKQYVGREDVSNRSLRECFPRWKGLSFNRHIYFRLRSGCTMLVAKDILCDGEVSPCPSSSKLTVRINRLRRHHPHQSSLTLLHAKTYENIPLWTLKQATDYCVWRHHRIWGQDEYLIQDIPSGVSYLIFAHFLEGCVCPR